MRKFLLFLLLPGCDAFLYDSVQFTGLQPPAPFKLTLSSHSNALYENDHLVVRMSGGGYSNFRYTTNNQDPVTSGTLCSSNELVFYRLPQFTLRIVAEKSAGNYTPQITRQIPAGNGTPGAPFTIATAVHLSNIRSMLSTTTHFRQTRDIDLSNVLWTPLGEDINAFTGSYNGAGMEIQNLTVNSAMQYTGLFGYCQDATLSNIIISTADIRTSSPNTAILCGATMNVNISYCYISGSMQPGGIALSLAGGLVGHLQGGIVDNCNVTLTSFTSLWDHVGGLAGRVSAGAIINYCNVNLPMGLSGRDHVGGLAGSIESTVNIYNSSVNPSTSYVTGNSNVGGFVGYSDLTPPGVLVNCAADIYVSGNDCVGGLVGQARGTTIREGIARGNTGTAVISTNSCAGGLVGAASNTIISNCSAYPQVYGSSNTGGIAGLLDSSVIYNCYFQANISSSGGTAWNLGGLAGRQQNGGSLVRSRTSGGSVSGSYNIGGLVGYAAGAGFILSECATYLSITGNDYLGGLVGYQNGGVSISDCCYSGFSISGNNHAGGLVGYQTSTATINNCFMRLNELHPPTDTGWAIGFTDNSGVNNGIVCITNSAYPHALVGSGLDTGISGYNNGDTIPPGAYTGWNTSIWDLSDTQDPWLRWIPH